MENFAINKSISAQIDFCNKNDKPYFAPTNGVCYKCHSNIYKQIGWKFVLGYKMEVPLDEAKHITGISVERAGKELITGCPHCCHSFCD
ncbi:hypothetical protein KM799_08475 [Clostridium tyrobutyricum]|uniref:hypothetical protein n=1 Tax=Clostridium tyrobutyricum TaxID=1519 RepID=UPI001C38C26E|nr:hypothetical protein [Clostridium tyrobutyricum]MBV4439272.1 hypothetical protein [Clostridium tyrobutyricum]MBV4446637.1 hypothetical protein [Clostridium tyrobutyricum]